MRGSESTYVDYWESEKYLLDGETDDLRYVKTELEKLARKLGLDNQARDFALEIYETIKSEREISSIDATLATSMYVATRSLGLGISLDEIVEHYVVRKTEVVSVLSDLPSGLYGADKVVHPTDYVERFVDKVNKKRGAEELDELGPEIIERAEQIIEISEQEGIISGRSPTGFAAAAIYLAAKDDYQRVRQSDLAEIAGKNPLTIRKGYQAQEEIVTGRNLS